MSPMRLPRSSSGTHITEVRRRFMTDSEFLNSVSFSASEMMSGWRLSTTRSMMESDSWPNGVRDGFAAQVARDLDHRLARFEQNDEALVGVADLDDHVEQLLEQVGIS